MREGERYGKLVLISGARTKGGRVGWFCRCDCGIEKIVDAAAIKIGNSRTCGFCNRKERAKNNGVRHGESRKKCRTRLWKCWMSIMRRVKHDPYYTNLGIGVCAKWLLYENFRDWAKQHGWQDGLTIDRIDNAKGYTPSNCRFATRAEQARNRTSTKMSWKKIARAKRLRDTGMFYKDIGALLGVHRQTVADALTGRRWRTTDGIVT